MRAVHEAARGAGLRPRQPRLLRGLTSVVVHLDPEPVVARAVLASGSLVDRHALEREIATTRWLAQHGAAVAPPARTIDPGPVERAGFLVTFWEYVAHDPSRPVDTHTAGQHLRAVHELLAEADIVGLPHFLRAEELTGLLDRLQLTREQHRIFERAMVVMGTALASEDLPLQQVHGDAHPGNVLMTSRGPLWTDFEKTCLGPVELDIACTEIWAVAHGESAADEEFLAGYGPHDPDLVRVLVDIQTLVLAAWTFNLAQHRPEFTEVAEQRLRAAAAGLGV